MKPSYLGKLFRAVRRPRVLVALGVLAVAAVLGGRALWGWHHLSAARSALEQYRTAEAQEHLAWCLAVWPSDLASSAGLRTDINGRVLTSERLPIPGLYAVGADAASIFRGTYPGPGTMIGPAMVFAWRAAMDIAGHLDTTQMRST